MPSMGSVGDAYDNAMAESFFATLECELLNRRRFKTQAEARMAVFDWIEGWYNPHRRHSSLGYLSPINYERKLLITETAGNLDNNPSTEAGQVPCRDLYTFSAPLRAASAIPITRSTIAPSASRDAGASAWAVARST